MPCFPHGIAFSVMCESPLARLGLADLTWPVLGAELLQVPLNRAWKVCVIPPQARGNPWFWFYIHVDVGQEEDSPMSGPNRRTLASPSSCFLGTSRMSAKVKLS